MSRTFGSLQNMMLGNARQLDEPKVGMGATQISYTDRYPYEVIAVKDSRHITVRALDHRRTDNNGFSEMQEYEYTSNEGNHTKELFRTKTGQWRERIGRGYGAHFIVGRAEYYYDFTR